MDSYSWVPWYSRALLIPQLANLLELELSSATNLTYNFFRLDDMLHALLVGALAASVAGPVLCPCSETAPAQVWTVAPKQGPHGQTVTTVSRNSTCLAVGNMSSQVITADCTGGTMPNTTKAWVIDFLPGPPPKSEFSWDYDTSLCLTAVANATPGSRLDVEPCSSGSRPEQAFAFGIADGHLINANPPFEPTGTLCVADAGACA